MGCSREFTLEESRSEGSREEAGRSEPSDVVKGEVERYGAPNENLDESSSPEISESRGPVSARRP